EGADGQVDVVLLAEERAGTAAGAAGKAALIAGPFVEGLEGGGVAGDGQVDKNVGKMASDGAMAVIAEIETGELGETWEGAGAGGLMLAAPAQAGTRVTVGVGVNFGGGYRVAAPVYYSAPAPVYCAPTYCAPTTVYYQQPVYQQQTVIYSSPVVYQQPVVYQ